MARSRLSTLLMTAGAALCVAGSWTGVAAAANSDSLVLGRISSDVPTGIRLGLGMLSNSKAGNVDGQGNERTRVRPAIVFADTAGRPLYAAGAACADECLTRWTPALAEADAKGTALMTIETNAAGKRQWAYQGKPLYTPVNGPNFSAPDIRPEWDLLEAGHEPGVRMEEGGADGMKLAVVNPKTWIKMPYSIGVAEYRLAPGQVLAAGVTGATPMGTPLYTYSGTAPEQSIPAMFRPQFASGISLPVGDFTVRTRSDGTHQWQYKGEALYTCECDISVGDLNGEGKLAGMAPATVFKYFLPKEVVLKRDNLSVGRMADARTGKTLYFRDRLFDFFQPDHSRPLYGTQVERIGAALNTAHCDAKCEKEWRPLFAPKTAKAEGYWTIYERPDGKRQWAYKNYAMYTYEPEGPGRLDGNEKHLVQFEDGTGAEALPKEYGLGLVWRAVVP